MALGTVFLKEYRIYAFLLNALGLLQKEKIMIECLIFLTKPKLVEFRQCSLHRSKTIHVSLEM